MNENTCGWCRRKAEELIGQLNGFREVTAAAEELAGKIKAKGLSAPSSSEREKIGSKFEEAINPLKQLPEKSDETDILKLFQDRPRLADLIGGSP